MKKSLPKLYPSTMMYFSTSNSNSNPNISRILGNNFNFFRCGNIFDSAPKFFRYKPTTISTFHQSQFNWNLSDNNHQHSNTTMPRGRNRKKSPPKSQPKRRGVRIRGLRNKNISSDTSPDSKKQKVLNLNDNFTITPIVVSPNGMNQSQDVSPDKGLYEGMDGCSTPPSELEVPGDVSDPPKILRNIPPLPDSPTLSPTAGSNPHSSVKELIQNFELPQNESTTSDKCNLSTSTLKDTESPPAKDMSKKSPTNSSNPPITKPILKTSNSRTNSLIDLTDPTSAKKGDH